MYGRPTWTDCEEAGDYVVPNVLSPRDLVFRPDNMDTHDRSLCGSSLIFSTCISSQKLVCHLKLALYTRNKVHMCCFRIETYLLRCYAPKWTHVIKVARLSMFMQNDRILQNFCWMPEAKWRFTTS